MGLLKKIFKGKTKQKDANKFVENLQNQGTVPTSVKNDRKKKGGKGIIVVKYKGK